MRQSARFTPTASLPTEIGMSAEDTVDAASAGLDQGEIVTIPSLPDKAEPGKTTKPMALHRTPRRMS
jgi:hypothetical protein